LKCIAWKGRALVVGFAGGEIEKVNGPGDYEFTTNCAVAQLPLNIVLLKNISIVGEYTYRAKPIVDDLDFTQVYTGELIHVRECTFPFYSLLTPL
jgi:hypothetical protein